MTRPDSGMPGTTGTAATGAVAAACATYVGFGDAECDGVVDLDGEGVADDGWALALEAAALTDGDDEAARVGAGDEQAASARAATSPTPITPAGRGRWPGSRLMQDQVDRTSDQYVPGPVRPQRRRPDPSS
jgi:hypothetical protein